MTSFIKTVLTRWLFWVLLGALLFTTTACKKNPFNDYKELESSLSEINEVSKKLDEKHLTADQIISLLQRGEVILATLQEGRDEMAMTIDRLTIESFEVNSGRIEVLKRARYLIYEGMDQFLVQTYVLLDLIRNQAYYHQRERLKYQIRSLQLSISAMVQKDPPLSRVPFSYYKNLPEITSQTADEEGGWYYTIEVNIGYNFNEKGTQTLINSSKVALLGVVRSYFSGLTKDYVRKTDESIIKAGLVVRMNEYLIQFEDFKEDEMEGVKLVTFDIIQFYEFH